MKKVLVTILKKLLSLPNSCVFTVALCSYAWLKLELNLLESYTSHKENVADFIKISCLNQKKQKHLLRLQKTN